MAAGEFSALKAVDVLDSLSDFEVGLRNRTEGITWIVWGLALPGMFLSYAFLGVLADEMPWIMPLMMFMWVPWVGVAYAATFTIWKSAGLALGEDPSETRESFRSGALRALLVVVAAWVLACVAGIVSSSLGWGPDGGSTFSSVFGALPLLLTGTITVLGGAVRGRAARLSADGRATAFVMGAVVLASAVGLSLSGWNWFRIDAASAVITGVTYLAGGFYRVARG